MSDSLVSSSGSLPASRTGPLSRGTLGRRLVVRVTALVALAVILIATATALATWQVLGQQVDRQLDDVAARLREPDNTRIGPGRGPDISLLNPGQPINTIAVLFLDGDDPDSGRLTESRGRRIQVTPLTDEAVQRIASLPTDGTKETISLPGLGRYRVVGYAIAPNGVQIGTAVVGVTLETVDDTLIALLGFAAVLSGIAVVGTVFVARSLVVRSLRPLNRVAGTAQQVSQLPLDRGEVALAVRVPPEDADPTSEVGRVGQALNHMLNNVEDALAARHASELKVRQFVADASHELRNPLAAIRGYAELTRRSRNEMPADAAYAMSRVESEAERMSHLVEDLLLLARLDSGPDLDIQPTDLSKIVLDAVSDARAAGPDHSWQLSLPDKPVEALGDPYRLHQVVANLLANARTHTPPGTQVRAGVSVLGNVAMITVSDNGPGIPTEIQNQVFERFTRADTSRVRATGAAQGKSTGLGLAIVSAVVEAHQGTVRVVSQPGHTEFVVQLPLAAVPLAGPTPPTSGQPHAKSHRGPGPDMAPPA